MIRVCFTWLALLQPDIAASIDQLGADDWHAREAASARLTASRWRAWPALQCATRAVDPEIAFRAGQLLDRPEGEVLELLQALPRPLPRVNALAFKDGDYRGPWLLVSGVYLGAAFEGNYPPYILELVYGDECWPPLRVGTALLARDLHRLGVPRAAIVGLVELMSKREESAPPCCCGGCCPDWDRN